MNPSLLINADFRAGCLVDQRQGRVAPPGVAYRATPDGTAAAAGTTDKYYTVTAYDADWWTIDIDDTTYYVYNGEVQTTRGYASKGFGVDMIKTTSIYAYTIEDGGIRLRCPTGGTMWIFRYASDMSTIAGQQYTASVLVDGNLYSYTFTATEDGSRAEFRLDKKTWGQLSAYGNTLLGLRVDPGVSSLVVAAKIEQGDMQTLAHQDASGSWVPNERPNYADTLRECLRFLYIQPDGASDFFSGVLTGSKKTLNVPIMLPAPMRTTPTLLKPPTITNVRTTKGDNVTPTVTSASPLKISGKDTMVVLTVATETFNDDAHTNNTPAAGYITGIALCAELL